jgi:hypothetical protein
MRKSGLVTLTVLVAAATMAFGRQESNAPASKQAMNEKAMMAMMEKFAMPGEGHKKLDVLVGSS